MAAAGIIYIADGKVLLTKRGDNAPDHAGEWAIPGGNLEENETAAQAAIRECREELGIDTDDDIKLVAERDGFSAFLKETEVFSPLLNDENSGYVWADPRALPAPIHPCAQSIINQVLVGEEGQTRTEMDVAKSIMAGDVSSPAKFGNVSLFAIRITGTGVAYRDKLKEYVFRNPELYLNDEFLQRCNGLTVILEHPKSNTLTSDEFNNRVIGSIVLPYFKGDEVWGIAKIYDESAINLMTDEITSTSPAVVFRDLDGNKTIELDNGEPLLIEGKPSLLDHLAICWQGVWDKGGPAAGVISENAIGDSNIMAEKDSVQGQEPDKLEKVLAGLDSLHKRLDSIEEKVNFEGKSDDAKKDDDKVEEEKVDDKKSKKDSKAKKDDDDEGKLPAEELNPTGKKADSDPDMEKKAKEKEVEMEALKKAATDSAEKLADLESRLPKAVSDDDYTTMADAQAKADSVYQAFGDSAPRPMNGESLLSYRKRLAAKLKAHSAQWKEVNLAHLDSAVFSIAEEKIYADASMAAISPANVPVNTLREVRRQSNTGHSVSEFYGSPDAWMGDFMASTSLSAINRPTH